MYGTGMRLMECVRLRVQDIDFGYGQIAVRNAKGGKDRVVPLPDRTVETLRAHLARVRELHQADLKEGLGEVYLPDALARKFPNAVEGLALAVCLSERAGLRRSAQRGACVAIICTRMRCRRR